VRFKKILNWLIPVRCLACGDMTLEANQLCAICWKSINFVSPPYCKVCGDPHVIPASCDDWCGPCLDVKPLYETARFVFAYNEGAKALILRLKYADDTNLVPTFAKWLVSAGHDLFEGGDYLVPVPLHWTRLLRRRYNQSALLAIAMKKFSPNLPRYAPQFLRRIRRTTPQGRKNKEERYSNVEGAFYTPMRHQQALLGKTVVLVDDVTASGATIDECVKVLLLAGCKSVRILTLAKSLRGG